MRPRESGPPGQRTKVVRELVENVIVDDIRSLFSAKFERHLCMWDRGFGSSFAANDPVKCYSWRTLNLRGAMSRGPGAVERGVLHALARYGPMNATELARDIFGLWGTLELEPTAAQPSRLGPDTTTRSQGGTKGSNPFCSGAESVPVRWDRRRRADVPSVRVSSFTAPRSSHAYMR